MIAKELIDQWWNEWHTTGRKEPILNYIAGLAASYGAAQVRESMADVKLSNSPDFIHRTNADYISWCATYYTSESMDERGMKSLNGLWAWQEQETRKQRLLTEYRESLASAVERGNQIVLLNARITALEAALQNAVDALEEWDYASTLNDARWGVEDAHYADTPQKAMRL